MSPSDFEYHRPSTLEEALSLLLSLEDAVIFSGGTDLLVDFRRSVRSAKNVIAIKHLPELHIIEERGDALIIGACCTHNDIARSQLIRTLSPEAAEAAETIGSEQIRNSATIGGNLCSAASCADMGPPLLVRRAKLLLHSSRGEREISVEKYFTGPRTTAMAKGEVLTRIIIPIHRGKKGSSKNAGAFIKFGLRDGSAISVASSAVWVALGENKIKEARIALGAVAPTPMVAEKAGAFLKDKDLSEENISAAASAAKNEARPISDVRGSGEFRASIVEVLTQRALHKAIERAGG